MMFYSRRRAIFVWRLIPLVAASVTLPMIGASAVAASQQKLHSTRASVRVAIVPRALSAAAHSRERSDHALVAHANAFASCARDHSGQPARCRPQRMAVQVAGRRLAHAERQLAEAARTASRARSAAFGYQTGAPELTVDGHNLFWTEKRSIDTFVLASRVPGQAEQFTVVHSNWFTPPAVPGAAVSYSVRAANAGSPWSAWKSISYSPGEGSGTTSRQGREGRQAAPTIAVSGQTLTWNRVDGVNVYVLLGKAPGRPETYSVEVGPSATPAPVPGATVRYTVRTAFYGSAWAPEVTISYPAQAGHSSGGKEKPREPPAEKPREEPPAEKLHEEPPAEKLHEEPPAEKPHEEPPAKEPTEPPAGDPNFQPGLVDGPNVSAGDLQAASLLGAKVVRVGLSINTSVAELEPIVAGYASKGIRVAPLAEFSSEMPTPAEAQNLATWAKAFGPGGTFWADRSDGQLAIRSIEFGNETASGVEYGAQKGQPAYTKLAQDYATRLREAAEAINASGMHVGMLAQEDDETGDWINGMYSAVPDLTKYVAGWVIHPYGGEQYNRGRLEELINQTAQHGASTIPIDATEWGVSTDNGRCLSYNEGLNRCMTYEEAGLVLKSTITWMSKMLGNRLGDFFLYQSGDQDITGQSADWQGYFGVLQHNLAPKGAYTAQVEALLSS
jgi:hypothetical protein